VGADSRTSYTAAQRVAIIKRSDEMDRWQQRLLATDRAAYARGREEGRSEGFIAGVAALKRQIRGEVDDFATEMLRWHVCCPRCRRQPRDKRLCVFNRAGCPRCEVRTRETFGQAHPGDYTGGPTGPVETRVWLAGPVVHRGHICGNPCRAFRPGWYEPAEAARILSTLPGDYSSAIAGLLAREQVSA
jgi:hypothetical protein